MAQTVFLNTKTLNNIGQTITGSYIFLEDYLSLLIKADPQKSHQYTKDLEAFLDEMKLALHQILVELYPDKNQVN